MEALKANGGKQHLLKLRSLSQTLVNNGLCAWEQLRHVDCLEAIRGIENFDRQIWSRCTV
eukprot:2914980-Karenia_brevis.AAC.1